MAKQVKSCASFTAEICMAGDISWARYFTKEFCTKVGLCVTFTETEYVYKGGEERGFIVRLINYPRFPKEPDQIKEMANKLAEHLMEHLHEESYTITYPDETVWVTTRAANMDKGD